MNGQTQAAGRTIPVFRAGAKEEMPDFVQRCIRALAPPAGMLPFRLGVVQLDADGARAFVAAEEARCADSFGQTVVTLDRARMRRGRFVTLFPEMEAEGLPCEVLCLDMTGAPALPEDGAELAAVLEFLGRFCQEGAVAWVMTGEAEPLARALAAALERTAAQ